MRTNKPMTRITEIEYETIKAAPVNETGQRGKVGNRTHRFANGAKGQLVIGSLNRSAHRAILRLRPLGAVAGTAFQ